MSSILSPLEDVIITGFTSIDINTIPRKTLLVYDYKITCLREGVVLGLSVLVGFTCRFRNMIKIDTDSTHFLDIPPMTIRERILVPSLLLAISSTPNVGTNPNITHPITSKYSILNLRIK